MVTPSSSRPAGPSARRLLPAAGSGLLLLLPALLAGCSKAPASPGQAGAGPPQMPPRPVIVAPVVARDVPLYLDEIGNCVAAESVQVQAQVNGQILARHFQDGADVKKGDLLFTIDPRPYQAALDQAQGTLAQSKAQLQIDQINQRRIEELFQRKVSAQQDLDNIRATVAADLAKVQSAEGSVASAQVNLDFCTIRSPIDGRIGLRQVDAGNVVNAASAGTTNSVLVTIQRLDPIYTDFTVAENDLPLVRAHLNQETNKDQSAVKVETDVPDDQAPPRQGELYFVDNAVQTGSGTVKMRGITPNPDRHLWPGLFVRVKLVLQTLKDARLVPSQAVQISQRGPFVFVVKPDKTIELRPVKPGQRQGDMVVVTDGLNAGENVVVTGQLALYPGARVLPQPANVAGGPPGGPPGPPPSLK